MSLMYCTPAGYIITPATGYADTPLLINIAIDIFVTSHINIAITIAITLLAVIDITLRWCCHYAIAISYASHIRCAIASCH